MFVDLLIKNAKIFNSTYRKFYDGYLSVLDGRIYHALSGEPPDHIEAKEVIDAGGRHVVPGLIDIHMHIESSMVTPIPFGSYLCTRGVTTVVAEPHEIANVKGMEAIRAMLKAGEGADIDIFFGVSSSVPSTDETLETTGGVIGEAELRELLQEPTAVCLGEVMNTRAVIEAGDNPTKRMIRLTQELAPHLPIEGHCPRIVGEDLVRYVYMGVDSTHTEHTLDETAQRYFAGMFIELQRKTLTPDISAHVIENDLFEMTALVTDDVMTDRLVREGHLEAIVVQAMEQGFTPEQAIYCATATPATRMRLHDRGRLRPGLLADIVILDDLRRFQVHKTIKSGRLAYDADVGYTPPLPKKTFPESFYHTMQLITPTAADFTVPCEAPGPVKVRAIEVKPDRTQTPAQIVEVPVKDGKLDWQSAGLKLALCFERHGKTKGGRGVGFMTGTTIQRGAVATSYAHDHHNLLVVGANPADMEQAAKWVIEAGGGMACVENGKLLGSVALPVAGLLSEEPVTEVAAGIDAVTKAMEDLGYENNCPIMSLCTTTLPVTPELKLTDKGLVDVMNGKIVPLIVE
ncbi:MAG: amidohydrolase family protein [Oscillospiraceae bacterium]|nr:amidohydrolase family protein [Oscillospiraceae bacterium]